MSALCFKAKVSGGSKGRTPGPNGPHFLPPKGNPGSAPEGGSSHLLALSPACNGILRFTPGVKSAELLVGSMAAELF